MKLKRKLAAFLTTAALAIVAMSTSAAAAATLSMDSYITMRIGESASISYRIMDPDNSTITSWSTSAPSVAEVSGGTIYGRGYGSATITATLSNGNSASCTVRVDDRYGNRYYPDYAYSRSRISMHTSHKTLNVGNTFSLDFSVNNYYDSSTGYTTGSYTGGYTYSSSSPSVAEVSSSGTVTAKKPGAATITVSLNNGNGSGTCSVVVVGWGDDGYYYGRDYWDDYNGGYYYDSYAYDNDYYDYYRNYRTSRNTSTPKTSPSSTKSSVTSAGTVKLTQQASKDVVVNKASQANGATAIMENFASVPAEALQAAAAVSTSPICFDTISGSTVVGRLVFSSANASKFSGNVLTGVYSGTGNTSAMTTKFNKAFSNRTQVVLIDQPSFSAPVEIAIKAPNLEVGNLSYYAYDSASNSYSLITVSNQFKDSSGYLHFSTTQGGYIIISEGALYKV